MKGNNLFVAAVDVGTFKNWGIHATGDIPQEQDVLTRCTWTIHELAKHLNEKKKYVALGFETPLWIPLAEQPQDLLRKRSIDCNRPWSAGAGAAVTTAALAVLPWWFSKLKALVHSPYATTDPQQWKPGVLLVWEAFISIKKTENLVNQHHQDAQDAVTAFCDAVENHKLNMPVEDGSRNVFSLATTMLNLSGWQISGNEQDHRPTLVIKSTSTE